MEIDRRITAFVRRHHVLTLATSRGGEPYCANMFYAWLADEGCFVFTSDESTRHIGDVVANDMVAASIVLETRVVGRLQGLQVQGTMARAGDTELGAAARKAYLRRFPYAAAMELNLWILRPTFLKYTDNTLGFGKKIIQTFDQQ